MYLLAADTLNPEMASYVEFHNRAGWEKQETFPAYLKPVSGDNEIFCLDDSHKHISNAIDINVSM